MYLKRKVVYNWYSSQKAFQTSISNKHFKLLTTMSNTLNNISLYIPHIFANFSKEDIAHVFEEQKIGKVKNIDLVSKINQQGQQYNTAYVHFDYWYDTAMARNFHSRVIDPNVEARLVYDKLWFWIVLENKARKYLPGERKPRIVIDQPSLNEVVKEVPTALKEEEVIPKNEKKEKKEVKPAKEDITITDEELEWLEQQIEHEEQKMEEIDSFIEEDDANLITIDGAYVMSLEEQVNTLQAELQRVSSLFWITDKAYQEEKIKSKALADAIALITK